MAVHVDEMLRDAVAAHQSGQLEKAQSIYAEILRLDELNPNALNLLGMIHHQQGRQEHAAELVSRAINAAATIPGFHNNLGTIRLAQRRSTEAEESFRKAIALDPDYVEAINNLAVSLIGQGKIDESIPHLIRATKLRHEYPSARNNLGNAWRAKRMYREAVDCYRDAIAFKPDHPEAWSNMAIAMLEMRDHAGAEEACRRAIAIRPDAVSAYHTLGLTLEESGRVDEAIEQFRAALRLRPNSAGLKFQLAALTGESTFDTMPPDFVASLFDHYADLFDRHLVGTLNYQGPQLLYDAVARSGTPGKMAIVDLGCGTGLCGVLFKPMAKVLIGVDLSSRMVNQARERKVYDALFVEEIGGFLAGRFNQFDLAIAADVLSYIGDLSGIFAAASQALKPRGRFAFTVEKSEAERFKLNATRRYSHSLAYIRSLLPEVRLREASSTEAVLRTQNKQDVAAWVVVVQKM
jgi:predicted TPR repeat methyltransferase